MLGGFFLVNYLFYNDPGFGFFLNQCSLDFQEHTLAKWAFWKGHSQFMRLFKECRKYNSLWRSATSEQERLTVGQSDGDGQW